MPNEPPLTVRTHGHGPPEGIVDWMAGDPYVDEDTGNVYVKGTDGGNTGWILVGGAGGTTQVYSGTWDDPTGHITPSGAAIYFKRGYPLYVWKWNTTLSVWEAIITPD